MLLLCAGPPGRDVWVGGYPGFANPSGELQPGLLREQTLRAVCKDLCWLNNPDKYHTAHNRRCKQPGAQAEAPRRG